MAITSKQRQAEYRQRMKAEGKVTFTCIINREQVPGMRKAAAMLAENPELIVAALRNVATGRYKKV